MAVSPPRESAGTGPAVLKASRVTDAAYSAKPHEPIDVPPLFIVCSGHVRCRQHHKATVVNRSSHDRADSGIDEVEFTGTVVVRSETAS